MQSKKYLEYYEHILKGDWKYLCKDSVIRPTNREWNEALTWCHKIFSETSYYNEEDLQGYLVRERAVCEDRINLNMVLSRSKFLYDVTQVRKVREEQRSEAEKEEIEEASRRQADIRRSTTKKTFIP